MAEQKNQDLNQLLKIRRDKLAELQANGKDPFQITKFNQNHHSLEVKNLYEAHEAELLKDRTEPDVTGLDEEQAKEVQKNDYEERRSIMDARESWERLLSAISRIYRETFRYMLQETLSEQILMQTLRNLISAISSAWKVLHSEPELVRFLFMQRK